ncbi:hypothetical protein J1N35_023763 [Gossypium stocksii]|uniref:Protein kinase domain-containing protein n=1 Tax=Gossypium stocksii TaxID=47602 RepID=A0A9D3VKL4_9ROSI|nr:hypothetical protein J1N35_023763 [Gossypium stocksii]
MFDSGNRQWCRNTSTGSPCWMATKVLEPGTGYNFKADIWLFGMFSWSWLMVVRPCRCICQQRLMTELCLTYLKFSKPFKDMVAMWLVKDQTKRPTADKLLKHLFLKHAKPTQPALKKLLNRHNLRLPGESLL